MKNKIKDYLVRLTISFFTLALGCTIFCTPSFANDSQFSTNSNNGFIGAFTDISQISNTYIDTSLSEPFEVFYNKGQLSVGTQVQADTDLYLAYSISNTAIIPNIVSVNIPLTRAIFLTENNFSVDSIYMLYNGSAYSTFNGTYDITISNYDFWINLYNFSNPIWQSNNNRHYVVIIKIHLNDLLYITNSGVQLVSSRYLIDSDTVRYNTYQNISYPIYLVHNNLIKIYNDLFKISRYFASDSKLAAEEASQQVIDSTLEDFTGSGSAAAKVSDSKAMKDVSGSIKSGLDTGASVSNATSVFNTGSDLWGWFTRENYNNINSLSGDIVFYISPSIYNYYLNKFGSLVQANNWAVSDYYDISHYNNIKIDSRLTTPAASICFYDNNFNYLYGMSYSDFSALNYSFSYPSNYYYVRFTIFLTDNVPSYFILFNSNLRKSFDSDIIDFYSQNQLFVFNNLGDKHGESSTTER